MASIWDLNVDDLHNANGDDDKGGAPKKVELIHDFVIKLGGGSHLPLNFFDHKTGSFGPKTLFQALFSVF